VLLLFASHIQFIYSFVALSVKIATYFESQEKDLSSPAMTGFHHDVKYGDPTKAAPVWVPSMEATKFAVINPFIHLTSFVCRLI
jgi:hypothetical protein